MKKLSPKEVGPFNVALAISHLNSGLEELVQASCGFSRNRQRSAMEWVVRVALLRRKGSTPEIEAEFDRAVEQYEKDFGWLHD